MTKMLQQRLLGLALVAVCVVTIWLGEAGALFVILPIAAWMLVSRHVIIQ